MQVPNPRSWLRISLMSSPWAQPNCTAPFGASSGCAFVHACAARVGAPDSKMNFDSNALVRHPEIVEMSVLDEE